MSSIGGTAPLDALGLSVRDSDKMERMVGVEVDKRADAELDLELARVEAEVDVEDRRDRSAD